MLTCTPGDPRSLPPFVLFRVPRAPSHLRRPLRVPSFAPTLLPGCQNQNRRHRLYSIPPPSNFFSPRWPSALSPGAAPNSCPSPVPQTRLFPLHPPSHPARSTAQCSAGHVHWLFARAHSMAWGAGSSSRSEPSQFYPPVWHTCLARQNPSLGSNGYQIPGTSMLETVEHSTSGSSPPPRELSPVPLFFVLLTSSYDLQSFKRVGVLRDPVIPGTRFPLSVPPPQPPSPIPLSINLTLTGSASRE